MAQVRIKLEIDGMHRLQTATGGRGGSGVRTATAAGAAGGSGGGGGGSPRATMQTVFRQWAKRYEGFARRRFNLYSRGGGDWPPLSPVTIARRRNGTGRKFKTRGAEAKAIRGKLFHLKANRSLSSAKASKLMGRLHYLESGRGVTILKDTGLMFNAMTIGAAGNLLQDLPNGIRFGFADVPHPGAHATIAQIAGYHNDGSRNNRPPQRLILAQPDQQTVQGMMSDLARGFQRIAGGRA